MKSIDIKIEAARRRAEAERAAPTQGTTYHDRDQDQHLRRIGAKPPEKTPGFEDTAPGWDAVLAARACRGCGCDVDPLFSYTINGQAPFCGDCYLQSTPGFSGPDDGSAVDSALRAIHYAAANTDLDDTDRAEVVRMLEGINLFLRS